MQEAYRTQPAWTGRGGGTCLGQGVHTLDGNYLPKVSNLLTPIEGRYPTIQGSSVCSQRSEGSCLTMKSGTSEKESRSPRKRRRDEVWP